MSKVTKQFNLHAKKYLKFRLQYPQALFDWIIKFSDHRETALDCGTGNGQAAIKLATAFTKVHAFDINENPLKYAHKDPAIEYSIMRAEAIDLPDNSIDLITSASAVHWFDIDAFYKECHRVLKPNGKIVVWSYSWPEAQHPSLAHTLDDIKQSIHPHWDAGSLLHLNGYKDLKFPFTEVEAPRFNIDVQWDIDYLLQFMSTWASIKNYVANIDGKFLEKTYEKLSSTWPDEKHVDFRFPIFIKAGSNPNHS